MSNDNFNHSNEQETIAEINRLFQKYDELYAGIDALNEERAISQRGLSILSDVKFYLRHPKVYRQFEAATLQLLKDYSKVLS